MMKTHLLAVGVTLIVGASVACYAADAETPKTVIAEVGELGENIYDLAKDKDWAKVGEKLVSLKKEAESLKSKAKEAKEAKKQLSKSIAALEKAVAAKDQQVTMQEANQITLIAGAAVACYAANAETPQAVIALSGHIFTHLPQPLHCSG